MSCFWGHKNKLVDVEIYTYHHESNLGQDRKPINPELGDKCSCVKYICERCGTPTTREIKGHWTKQQLTV